MEFDSVKDVEQSPLLSSQGRRWARHLPLKSSLLATFFLLLSLILSLFPQHEPLSKFFLVGVYFFAGIPSLIEAIEDLARFDVNIDVLMTLAAFSSVVIGSGAEGGLLLVLFALSGAIEDAVTAKAKGAISSLKKLSPTKAFLILKDATIIERSVDDIEVGAHILVKAGEIVPLDGVVIKGSSSVNLVHLTGENLPLVKSAGDNIPAGGRNLEGALTIRVTQTSSDSTLSKIIELVTEAQESKPLLQRWFDRVTRGYALFIIILSALFAALFPLFLQVPYLGANGSVYRALSFLIASSPCALILATPIAYLSSVSVCAWQGILLKGGVTLDALASSRAIAFDKTGTLTTGTLCCLSFELLEGESSPDALSIAMAMEQNALHPISKAVIEFAKEQGTSPAGIEHFTSSAGYGLQCTFREERAYLGRFEMIKKHVEPSTALKVGERIRHYQELGELLAFLLYKETLYLFRFSDTVRPFMKQTIDQLKKRGDQRLLMLSGDHADSVKRIAEQVGIEEYYADLLPKDKLRYVAEITDSEGLVMIGDGINDAPALARATVGICMGKVGSSTAVEAADVVFLHDDLTLLNWLLEKADQTQKIVKQNLTVAIVALLVASCSALLGLIPLWIAVIMHEGGTVLVGLNALRLLKR